MSYFNPDYCAKEYCEAYGEEILTDCVGCYQNVAVPMFIRAECASLIGNVSLLYSESMNIDQYNVIMDSFQRVIFTPMDPSSSTMQGMTTRSSGVQSVEEYTVMRHELSLLRGKSLEGAALIGKAVGKDVFLPTAILFLNQFMDTYQKVNTFSSY